MEKNELHDTIVNLLIEELPAWSPEDRKVFFTDLIAELEERKEAEPPNIEGSIAAD